MRILLFPPFALSVLQTRSCFLIFFFSPSSCRQSSWQIFFFSFNYSGLVASFLCVCVCVLTFLDYDNSFGYVGYYALWRGCGWPTEPVARYKKEGEQSGCGLKYTCHTHQGFSASAKTTSSLFGLYLAPSRFLHFCRRVKMNTTKYALEGSLKRKETLKKKGKRNTKQFAFLVRRVMGILRARCVLFALVGKKNSNELYLVHGQSKKKNKKKNG